MSAQQEIQNVCTSMQELLLEKNKRYGNSALQPVGIFSRQDSGESIKIRLDDKIGRIQNSHELRKNDVADLIGYLVLLAISEGWTDFGDLID